jgi:hypothetical protein
VTQHPNQPQNTDAVLGGQAAIPRDGVVLGSLEGLRRRLTSPSAEQRSIALSEALQYGQRGLNLIIRALNDPSPQVQQTAYGLLRDRSEPKVVRALEQFYVRSRYAHLQKLLATHEWQMADQETRIAMLKVLNLSSTAQLRAEHMSVFPCSDLRVIDQLWVQHSKGKFGFSVQNAIWQKYHTLYWDKAEVWKAFANRVGWRVDNLFVQNHWKRYGEIAFSLNAPTGHLPFLGDQCGIFTVEAIANRLQSCQLKSS